MFVARRRSCIHGSGRTPHKRHPLNYRTIQSHLRAFALPALAALVALPSACASNKAENAGSTESSLGIAPPLGAAASFMVLGGTTVTNTGPTVVGGDMGVDPGLAITGFPPGIVVGGTTHKGDAVALQAQTDVTAAYGVLAGEPCSADLTGKDLGGLTLVAGVYCFSSSAQLTGDLTLDAQGKPDAVFVFKTVSTLTTASNASVRVINGGNDCAVFWQIGSSAVLGTGTTFVGSVLALTSISLASGAKISGRALARNGAVTMDTNNVSTSTCKVGPSDAGVVADASVADAGLADSGRDASPSADAGSTPSDAGNADATSTATDAASAVDAWTGP